MSEPTSERRREREREVMKDHISCVKGDEAPSTMLPHARVHGRIQHSCQAKRDDDTPEERDADRTYFFPLNDVSERVQEEGDRRKSDTHLVATGVFFP